eukprot:1672129-Lingulodinium_polyedra.AAC.1
MSGMLHVCHNLLKDVCSELPGFEEWKTQMKDVSTVLTSPWLKDRLKATCFAEGTASWYVQSLGRFSAQPLIEWRFGSIVAFVLALCPLEMPLRAYFKGRLYDSKPDDVAAKQAKSPAGA